MSALTRKSLRNQAETGGFRLFFNVLLYYSKPTESVKYRSLLVSSVYSAQKSHQWLCIFL